MWHSSVSCGGYWSRHLAQQTMPSWNCWRVTHRPNIWASTGQNLRQLLVLRGRASHAQSKTGIRELTLVERACSTHLPRLRCLAQRVILTKADRGRPSRDVDELSPLRAYIGTTGELKLIAPQIPTADHDDVKASWRDE